MPGKIQPNVRQQFSVVNVADEKGKYCVRTVRCKHCSSEFSGSTKAATNART